MTTKTGFLFGWQSRSFDDVNTGYDIRTEAIRGGWISTDPLQNNALTQSTSSSLNLRATLEPIDGFRIDVKDNNPKMGFKTLIKIYGNIVSTTYITYKNGTSPYNWKQNLEWSEYLAK